MSIERIIRNDEHSPVAEFIRRFHTQYSILTEEESLDWCNRATADVQSIIIYANVYREQDDSCPINYNTQRMEERFVQEGMSRYALRTYKGSIGAYSLIVNDAYLIRAVVLPENFYYQRWHVWARGSIDMNKVIILVDESLEDPQLSLNGLRKLYVNRLDPILRECGADVWVVPQGFIGRYTTVQPLRLSSNVREAARQIDEIFEKARNYISGNNHTIYDNGEDEVEEVTTEDDEESVDTFLDDLGTDFEPIPVNTTTSVATADTSPSFSTNVLRDFISTSFVLPDGNSVSVTSSTNVVQSVLTGIAALQTSYNMAMSQLGIEAAREGTPVAQPIEPLPGDGDLLPGDLPH